jgi:hypothetical protein
LAWPNRTTLHGNSAAACGAPKLSAAVRQRRPNRRLFLNHASRARLSSAAAMNIQAGHTCIYRTVGVQCRPTAAESVAIREPANTVLSANDICGLADLDRVSGPTPSEVSSGRRALHCTLAQHPLDGNGVRSRLDWFPFLALRGPFEDP